MFRLEAQGQSTGKNKPAGKINPTGKKISLSYLNITRLIGSQLNF
jgi:hypothetical protein